MCDPLSLAIAGTAVATVGTAVSGYMTYQQQIYQRNVARENARRESARAADRIDLGAEEQRNLGRRYSQLAGSQRAALAANGVDLDFGSAADFLGDTASFYREDTATLDRNISNEVKGIDISAANYTAQAQAAGMAATGTAISTAFDMGSTVLGGVGRAGKINANRQAGGGGWGGF